MIRSISYNSVRIFVGLVLVLTGLIHLQNIPGHFVTILNYRFISFETAQWLAMTLPALHLFLGLALTLREFTAIAATVASLIFLGYAIAQLIVFVSGFQINCGCFGTSTLESVGWNTIFRTTGFLIAFIFVAIMERGAKD